MATDTIFALASGAGRAAIAVIRVSGPATRAAVKALCGRLPEPRRASLATLRAPDSGEILDRALVLWLPGPGSFTAEDCAEFHTHGGRAVVEGVLGAIGSIAGCRPAEPGEFTRRAFLNGRMDLTGVEALADLIDAETAAQRRQALRHLDGPLGARTEAWRGAVLGASALVEAEIDFSDEGDVGEASMEPVRALLAPVAAEIATLLAQERGQGMRMRDGFTVVVAGPPNVGKSTLMNALAQRDVSIVSPLPGTTRDLIEAHLDLHGLPIVLVDTAGLRESDDAVEREGTLRARRRAEHADLVLWLEIAGSAGAATMPALAVPVTRVVTQVDRVPRVRRDPHVLTISAVTGEGMPALLDHLHRSASEALVGGETSLMTRARHRDALVAARDALCRVVDAPAQSDAWELVAEDVRVAARQLGRIAGRIDVEEVLGEIFGRFCIGK